MKKININSEFTGNSNITTTLESVLSTTIFDFDKRKNFDDYRQYNIFNLLYYDNFSENIKNILKEFPEVYLTANSVNINTSLKFVITNIGLYAISSDSSTIIYDILGNEEEDYKFEKIFPDYSLIKNYNIENNPLGVRYVNIEKDKFKPVNSFSFNNQYYKKLNVDAIPGWQLIENESTNTFENGYFKSSSDENITKVCFNYKPIFILKLINNTIKDYIDDGIILKINDINIKTRFPSIDDLLKYENNDTELIVNLSSFPFEENISNYFFEIELTENNEFSGTLEVK